MSESALNRATGFRVALLNLPRGWRMERQRHQRHWEVLLPTDGRLHARVAQSVHEVGSGDVMIYPAGFEHEEWNDGEKVLRAIYLRFDAPMPTGDFPVRAHDRSGRFAYLAVWMLEAQSFPRQDQRLFDSLGQAFVQALQQPSGLSDMIDRVRRFIRQHLREKICLDDLASAAGLSRSYFIRALRREAGITPMRLLQQLRVEAACGLMAATVLPLKAIAEEVGFADAFHMAKVFRRLVRRSPSSFRDGGQTTPKRGHAGSRP